MTMMNTADIDNDENSCDQKDDGVSDTHDK